MLICAPICSLRVDNIDCILIVQGCNVNKSKLHLPPVQPGKYQKLACGGDEKDKNYETGKVCESLMILS